MQIIEYSNDEETAVCNLLLPYFPSCIVEKDYSKMEVDIYSKPNCTPNVLFKEYFVSQEY